MFNFASRISRKDYYVQLFVSIVLVVVFSTLVNMLPDGKLVTGILAVAYLVGLVVWLVFLLCLVRKRANDIGWHPLLLTAVSYGIVVPMLLIGAVPGTKQPNAYGPATV